MRIADLVFSPDIMFTPDYRITSYKRITDELRTVYDSKTGTDIPPDVLNREINLIAMGDDNVIEIEYESDDETIDTRTLLNRAYSTTQIGKSFIINDPDIELMVETDFETLNHDYYDCDEGFKFKVDFVDYHNYTDVTITFLYDTQNETDVPCGTVTVSGESQGCAVLRYAAVIAANTLYEVNHLAYCYSQGAYAY